MYDLDAGSVQAKTLKRARDAYDMLVDQIELQVRGVWEANAEITRKFLAETGSSHDKEGGEA